MVSLRVRDGQGERDMEGDVFFSSMPLKDLVAGMNDVPADVQEIAAGLPTGTSSPWACWWIV